MPAGRPECLHNLLGDAFGCEIGGHFDIGDAGLAQGFAFDGVAQEGAIVAVVAPPLIFDGRSKMTEAIEDREIKPFCIDRTIRCIKHVLRCAVGFRTQNFTQ